LVVIEVLQQVEVVAELAVFVELPAEAVVGV
jgi:hypothetical protein